MTSKIEQDAKRVNIYNGIQTNLDLMKIHKANYDYLTNQVNNWMEEMKMLVEDETVTEFTTEDFDAVLKLRDKHVSPVVEMKEYQYYTLPVQEDLLVENVVEPTVEPVIEETNIIVTNE